jgi:hypothetical protein
LICPPFSGIIRKISEAGTVYKIVLLFLDQVPVVAWLPQSVGAGVCSQHFVAKRGIVIARCVVLQRTEAAPKASAIPQLSTAFNT